ncbi:3-dehydroquinate synthase II [Methanolapillus millepedarum]|uniref:3-dehydroquinate synthase n=1 Tax=Methanolapillus millepedarum TaxID=3028296 RepID=A0AA96ZUI8_9EURY|nr:3-dehydroquinate synthase [Methanosarcinaceae archaeon Ac7]
MKTAWIKADEGDWEQKKDRITMGLESGIDFVFANPADISKIKKLGTVKVACFYDEEKEGADVLVMDITPENSDVLDDYTEALNIKMIRDLKRAGKTMAGYVDIQSKKAEKYAAEAGKQLDYLIISANDWRIIPLENLIAALEKYEVKIIACVHSGDEVKTAAQILEKGVDGVLIDCDDPDEIRESVSAIKFSDRVCEKLSPATVTKVQTLGMGDRVCVDTCNLMEPGEGMLVGSQSSGMFLVQAEVEESQYVASRPFRVNAGAVYSYVKVGEMTRYLSELQAGDDVTIVNEKGETRPGIVGRVKIESRPMMLVEAEADGKKIKVILQNAETIKLVRPDGKSIPITDLKEGDKVLVKTEKSGRHFGMSVNEKIIEN